MNTKKEAPTVPAAAPQTKKYNESIARPCDYVNPLRTFRIMNNIPAADIVSAIRSKFPRYDKTLQSKCERTEVYGVQLAVEGAEILSRTFKPINGPFQAKTPDRHRFTRRISCRLPEDVFCELQLYVQSEGHGTMQDWLSSKIHMYLRNKRRTKKEHINESGD
ncbi:MAG: hypothetical protein PHQ85_08930 [Eubacteriales bacterium]|nr:hypothetical protein [Eubacteriales bacterium]MDD4711621.1 hypothetical protein [Eubacteriales bacterium]